MLRLRNSAVCIALLFGFTIVAFAQLPKLPKFDKPKLPKDGHPQPAQTPAAVPNQPSATAQTTMQPEVRSEPMILKPTLYVKTDRVNRYFKQPDVENFWSWIPVVGFDVVGPIPSGSFFNVEVTMPDGKPWLNLEVEAPKLEAGKKWGPIETAGLRTHQDNRTIVTTGTFGLRITLKNSLDNTARELFSGRFKVGKFHVGNNLPAFKNQFEFYVDQDWRLPIGYLRLGHQRGDDTPTLTTTMWFRGENESRKLVGYLFYNGKEIANTETTSGGASIRGRSLFTPSGDEQKKVWEEWTLVWFRVLGFNRTSSRSDDVHFLDKNPGNYEIKVLCDGELVRTASFTVGPDGKIVDNGIAMQNGLGGNWVVLPVKISGTKDGQWDKKAWETDAFYGNPLKGFVAP